MMRGTFANIRIKNGMVRDADGNPIEGGITVHHPSGERLAIYDAAMRYQAEGRELVVFAGKEYGTGSSRDWAAKGTKLLGVRAVIAESFERIHRSNLIGMGVLPLQFKPGESWAGLGLTGEEKVSIANVGALQPAQFVNLQIVRAGGATENVEVLCRIDTQNEVDYFRNGGILHYVLRGLARAA
jgi:aconitate hydratase